MNNNYYLRLWQVVLAVTLTLCPQAMRADDETPFSPSIKREDLALQPQSPSVWGMIRYGQTDVDLFHGTAGITIPFYMYKDRDFEIPVNFCYASTGYLPGNQSGPLGQDWVLSAGGAITREVRGIPDESQARDYAFKWFGDPGHGPNSAYGSQSGTDYNLRSRVSVMGFYHMYNRDTTEVLEDVDYVYSGSLGEEYFPFIPISGFTSQARRGYETQPDIFHFSAMGLRGSFYLTADHRIKVFDSNVPAGDVTVQLTSPGTEQLSFSILWRGYRYTFGFQEEITSYVSAHSGSADTFYNAWRLTRIDAPNGRNVVFNYGTERNTSTMSPAVCLNRKVITVGSGSPQNEWQTPDYDIQNPWHFENSSNITTNELSSIVISGGTQIVFSYDTNIQLSGITVTNTQSGTVRSCAMTYLVKHGRLCFLKSVTIPGEGTYRFKYIDEEGTFAPITGTDAADLYGYYSGSTYWTNFVVGTGSNAVSTFAANIMSARQPVFQYTKKGMLEEIVWPVGGKTVLTYEQNHYQRESKDGVILQDSLVTGGVRIREVRSLDSDGSIRQIRRFSYKLENGKSSGILLSKPDLYWHYCMGVNDQYGQGDSHYLFIDRESVTTASPLGYGLHSHIEYSRVVDETTDANGTAVSRTVMEFEPSFGSTGQIEYDSQNASSTLYTTYDSWGMYFSGTVISNWDGLFLSPRLYAGKEKESIQADGSGKPSSRKENVYGAYNPYGDVDEFPVVRLCKLFTHHIRPISSYCQETRITDYDLAGMPVLTSEISRMVDFGGHPVRFEEEDSRSRSVCSDIRYNTVCPYMPEQVTRTLAGKIVRTEKTDYDVLTSLTTGASYALPEKRWKGTLSTSGTLDSWREDVSYLSYDAYGNPTQLRDSTGKVTSIVWTSDGLYPASVTEGGPGGLTTLYEWQPLVGMTKKTDPSGRYQTFEYDTFGRLVAIKDEQGNLIQHYEYNVASTNNNQ
ncbi:MAG: RHS repeat protein [Bacteroidales bacterium]|nr:RHS repeat protein [Bacteroidales bacterium]